MGKEGNNIFFVELKDPTEVKKAFLECLKSILESLERFEEFKGVRNKKINKINKLKSIIKEINKLVSNLGKKFPETDVHMLGDTVQEFDKLVSELKEKLPKTYVAERIKEKLKEKKHTEVKISREKPVSELEKLESELIAIEEKLKDLE